jgi:iron complex transport system permease protein
MQYIMLFVIIPCIAYMVYTSHRMNALLLGDATATSIGINVTQQALIWITLSAFAVSVTVSLIGPLGFIGLIVPQCARLILGHDHRLLVPASALFGATFLIICDVLARTVIEQGEMPVGVITALIGAPAFLIIQGRQS